MAAEVVGEVVDVPHGTHAADAAAGREVAFRACFTEHYGRLAGYCAALVGDVTVAHDIAQEAFTRLYARWFAVTSPRAYVYWIATNLVRERWRRARTERAALESIATVTPTTTPASDPWLRDLVARLPEAQRDVVLLHYYADLPVEEVARLVHRPVGTVKRRLHEARAMLARAVEEGR